MTRYTQSTDKEKSKKVLSLRHFPLVIGLGGSGGRRGGDRGMVEVRGKFVSESGNVQHSWEWRRSKQFYYAVGNYGYNICTEGSVRDGQQSIVKTFTKRFQA